MHTIFWLGIGLEYTYTSSCDGCASHSAYDIYSLYCTGLNR